MSSKTDFKQSMIDRIDKRVRNVIEQAEKIKKGYIESIKFDQSDAGESERIWLDQFAVGNGLDICCGDFIIGDSIGVDGSHKVLGVDYHCEGDELNFQKSDRLDYVVSNYLDGFHNPLKALVEWRRVLKDRGTLAVTVRDADTYSDQIGPLANGRRGSAFTEKTLRFYLTRAGFQVQEILKGKNGTLRAHAKAVKK